SGSGLAMPMNGSRSTASTRLRRRLAMRGAVYDPVGEVFAEVTLEYGVALTCWTQVRTPLAARRQSQACQLHAGLIQWPPSAVWRSSANAGGGWSPGWMTVRRRR